MPQIVHIANTDVEFEFAHSSLQPLEKSWSRHPLCLQLQFLPLLYAQPEDSVAVTTFPNPDYLAALQRTGWWPNGLPQLMLLQTTDPLRGAHCLSWGPSRRVQAWAHMRQMHYDIPSDWQTVRLINSKAFSFRYSRLPEASLLYHEHELIDWLHGIEGVKVIKTCFGLSGQGNRLIDASYPNAEDLAFCRKEWHQGRPLIAEPWLNRLCDFSTQWFIHPDKQIEGIGAARFDTNSQGIYQGTLAGPEKILFAGYESFLQEHKQLAQQALKEAAALGFFGSVGVDALLYRCGQTESICLYPIVEINGRQTMSLVAMRLQQRLCPNQILRLSFHKDSLFTSSPSLLPQELVNSAGKRIHFKRALIVSIE